MQNPVAESDNDILKVGGTNGHSNLTCAENVFIPCVSETEGMTQEKQMGNIKQLIESAQVTANVLRYYLSACLLCDLIMCLCSDKLLLLKSSQVQ